MENRIWLKLLVLIIFLGLLQGSIFAQNNPIFLKSDSIACDTFPPPRNIYHLTFDNTILVTWEVPVLDSTLSTIPNNLFLYKILRDGEDFDTVFYTGEDTVHYYDDLGVGYPSSHEYYVCALYDLTLCGLAGEIGQSECEGPVIGAGYGGFILSFTEDWSTGSFDPYLWTADEYWYVDGPYGYPSPCATYSNFPDTAYSQSLISYWIDCRDYPISGTPYIDGDIYLEFDVQLNHLPMSGIDYLNIEITDSIEWHILEQFSTEQGSFGWTNYKINITEWAKGEYIRFAFVAHGEDGSNIHDWYIDNIVVSRECNPPRDLHWVSYDNLMAWSSPLPHSYNKNNSGKELLGYNVYYDNSHLGFTTDTFYSPNPPLGYGLYYVTAVYEDCEPESNHIYSPVGIKEIEKNPEIKAFPNPCDQNLSVHSSESMQELQVFNSQGRIVYSNKAESKLFKVNTSTYPDGIYFLKTQTGGTIQTNKFIISH